ncbi:MAG: BamA/TamA family outer membrane protein [Desulfuromonadales bacterium]|nr:BamA/TamA family outer membrane protein [Desulfuromonadales bacterium]
MRRAVVVLLTLLLLLTTLASAWAEDSTYGAATSSEADHYQNMVLLPYPFYNDTIGAGIGVAAIAEGYLQSQTMTVGSGLFSIDGNGMVFLMARNHRLPFFERMFIEPTLSAGKFQDMQIYTVGNPKYPNEIPGSNDSNKNNYRESDAEDYWADLNFKLLLPIGHGKDNLLPSYTLVDGIPTDGHPGGHSWNPWQSGRTFLETEFFYRNQELDEEELSDQETMGIEMALSWDNTDFYPNPSKGSFWRVFGARDWGALSSSPTWTIVGGEVSKYIDLGASESARQRTLALNFWTVDSPTWNSSHTEAGEDVYHRPPSYKGANLGGLWRLRGFPATRFRDRSAVHYSAEYRHTLNWNPLKEYTMGGHLDIDWIQLVGFGDLGRVADEWKLDTLHEDMKWTAGVGARVMVNRLVVRVDVAASDEDVITQLFISHPWPKR